MLSLDQLTLMVKEHLGFYSSEDGIQHESKWTIAESPLGGRGIFATEDLMSGEVLFVDHPLIRGPRAGNTLQAGCSVCNALDSDTFFKCSNCALLLCSKECQDTSTHYNDCEIISRWSTKVPIDEVDHTLLSRALTAIRALTLNEDQKRLMELLESHTHEIHGSEIRILNNFFVIPKEDEKLMVQAAQALDANAFQIVSPYGKKEVSTRGLYPVSSLMNHCCTSNTRYSFNRDGQMTVKVVKPIKAGDEIFTCYSGVLWGTAARRAHLFKTKHFWCKCDRCADPTERGTYLAALKCFDAECSGSLLPLDPLKASSAWRCLDCGLRVPFQNISAVQSALGSLMGTLNFEDVKELEFFLNHRVIKFIPETNQIILDLQCRLIWELGETDGYRWHGAILISGHVYIDGRPQSAAARSQFYNKSPLKKSARNMDPYICEDESKETASRNWIIKTSELGGRGIFASRPIKKGSLIFSNPPLAVGPRADITDKTCCSICFNRNCSCYPCEKCALLVCSEDCANSPLHAKECAFISLNWTLKRNATMNTKVQSEILIFIRLLLLNEEQKQLLKLLQKSNNSYSNKNLDILCSEYILPGEHLKSLSDISSILKTNSFRISWDPEGNKTPLRGVYPLSSFLNHNCVPNTRNVFKADYTMLVYASKDIGAGEEILTCYTGILWCTPARRCQLYKTKQFWCQCERCKDPTEFGTRLSALKCFIRECVGVLLPITPTDPNTSWCCDNCNKVVAYAQVGTVQSVLGSLIGTLDLDEQFRLQTPILERLSRLIPYSNHIFADLRLRLTFKLGFTEGLQLNELSEPHLALKENLCRGTLRTVAALGAGDAHLRGQLLYHLHAALAERARRSPDLYEELKSEIESTIEQAYTILQDDISAPPDLELRHRYLGPGCDKPHEERFLILTS